MADLSLAVRLFLESRGFDTGLNKSAGNVNKFTGTISRSVSVMSGGLDRVSNRYGALLTGFAGLQAVRGVMSMEDRIVALGDEAGFSADKMNELKRQIFDVAQQDDIKLNPDQLLDALDMIVQRTDDLEFAQKNIRNIGLAIRSTGQDGATIGEMTAAFHQMGIVLEDDVLAAFDILKRQNLSKLSPQVVASYAALGRTGVPAIRELGAALKTIEQGAGSQEAAIPVFQSLLSTLTDVDKLKVFQAGGIQVFDPKQPDVMRPIHELLGEIITRAGGNVTVLRQIFDPRAMKGLNAAVEEFKRTGSIESIDRWYQVQADGSRLQEGAAARAATFSAAVSDLNTEFRKFADKELVGPMNDMTEFLRSLDSETLQRWMTLGKWLALGLGGLMAARGVFRLARDVFNAGRFVMGKGGSAGGSMGGGTPVYVTNMGGMGGIGSDLASLGGLGRSGGWLAKLGILARGAGAVGLAGTAGYAAGTLIDKGLQRSEIGLEIRDQIGRAVAIMLAAVGNDDAVRALANNEKKFQGTLEVKLTKEGDLRVDRISTNGDGPEIESNAMFGLMTAGTL